APPGPTHPSPPPCRCRRRRRGKADPRTLYRTAVCRTARHAADLTFSDRRPCPTAGPIPGAAAAPHQRSDMNLIFHALEHAFEDSLPMLPFLFLAYLLIEWIERHHGDAIERALAGGGRWGFVPGAVLGCVPQCGFSALAANLYASRVITPGTLLAGFLATSDEAVPLLSAASNFWGVIPALLIGKVAAGILGGLLLDVPLRKVLPAGLYGGYAGHAEDIDCHEEHEEHS